MADSLRDELEKTRRVAAEATSEEAAAHVAAVARLTADQEKGQVQQSRNMVNQYKSLSYRLYVGSLRPSIHTLLHFYVNLANFVQCERCSTNRQYITCII